MSSPTTTLAGLLHDNVSEACISFFLGVWWQCRVQCGQQ